MLYPHLVFSSSGYITEGYTDADRYHGLVSSRPSARSDSRSYNSHQASDLSGIADNVQLQRAGSISVASYVDLNSQYIKRNDLTLDDYMSNNPYSPMPLMVEKKHTCPYCQRAFGTSSTLFKVRHIIVVCSVDRHIDHYYTLILFFAAHA